MDHGDRNIPFTPSEPTRVDPSRHYRTRRKSRRIPWSHGKCRGRIERRRMHADKGFLTIYRTARFHRHRSATAILPAPIDQMNGLIDDAGWTLVATAIGRTVINKIEFNILPCVLGERFETLIQEVLTVPIRCDDADHWFARHASLILEMAIRGCNSDTS